MGAKAEVVCVEAKVPLTERQWAKLEKHGKDCFANVQGVSDIDWSGHFGMFLYFTVERMEKVQGCADLLLTAINSKR